MQRRDANAPRLPGYLGFFGGGVEPGESPEDALVREVREELEIPAQPWSFFSRYESLKVIQHVFILEATPSFESTVTVKEGQYGLFADEHALHSELVCDSDRMILTQLLKTLRKDFTW
jgi:8-oxo-dGTP pyrophosphatase MutT (NUDIX family)